MGKWLNEKKPVINVATTVDKQSVTAQGDSGKCVKYTTWHDPIKGWGSCGINKASPKSYQLRAATRSC